MRHAYFGRRLSRDTNARKALLNSLASSLFEKGQIKTTLAKAKFARPYVEKLITRSKRKYDLKGKRLLAALVTSQAFTKLNTSIGPGFTSRPGGYTRIIKLNPRAGDAAPMARLELLKIEKQPTVEKTKKAVKSASLKGKQNSQSSVAAKKQNAKS